MKTFHIELYQHAYAAWINFWGPPGMVVWIKETLWLPIFRAVTPA